MHDSYRSCHLNYIRGWPQDLYYKCRTYASMCESRLSNYTMTILKETKHKASIYKVKLVDS